MEKLLLPIYVPKWFRKSALKLKHSILNRGSESSVNILGERTVEWSFLNGQIPNGPGEALEFGCEEGNMSLAAAQKGFHVIANDLQEQTFTWQHPNVEFCKGDFLSITLPPNRFDLVINCSSVEHVGIAGRYGIRTNDTDGDLQVMDRLAEILKPSGILLMTAPCGQDAVLAPWCRVYGPERLPILLRCFSILKEEYWIKNAKNQWVQCSREAGLSFQPRNDRSNPHRCAYALGCFVLRKIPKPVIPSDAGKVAAPQC